MKIIAITLLVLHILSINAFADVFQIISSAKQISAVSAAVTHKGRHIGYTNDLGIIIINQPRGRNNFTVSYMGRSTNITLTVSGNAGIQTVTIP